MQLNKKKENYQTNTIKHVIDQTNAQTQLVDPRGGQTAFYRPQNLSSL